MRRTDVKSHCPVNFALEVFGDSWSLLIVRDIVFWGKHTYGEFLASSEGISTNVLASRLTHLEKKGIIESRPYVEDRRKEFYTLTPKGLDLIPVLLEMAGWSCSCDQETTAPPMFVEKVLADRDGMFRLVRTTVESGGSLFGPGNNVLSQLN